MKITFVYYFGLYKSKGRITFLRGITNPQPDGICYSDEPCALTPTQTQSQRTAVTRESLWTVAPVAEPSLSLCRAGPANHHKQGQSQTDTTIAVGLRDREGGRECGSGWGGIGFQAQSPQLVSSLQQDELSPNNSSLSLQNKLPNAWVLL